MKILLNLLLSGVAVLIATYLIPGVNVDSFWIAVLVSIVFGLVNAVIRPVVVLLTLPVNILTLGLFSFVIIAMMVTLTARIVPGFTVDGFFPAVLFGLVESVVSGILFKVMPEAKK